MNNDLLTYIPTTRKEIELRGWDDVDVVFFSADAYVDHPSFGAAVIARTLEHAGYRVAIVPQPDWHGDHRDFTKFGRPKLFFMVSGGAMDSMVNHYTAARRRRSDDAYTPDGRPGARPDRAVTVYTQILKQHYPDVPVIIGGIEASQRRFTHYDYWSDTLMPSILVSSGADILQYGMGEQSTLDLADAFANGRDWHAIPQIAFLTNSLPEADTTQVITLASHEEALRSKRAHAANFALIETESNKVAPATIVQPVGSRFVVVNPTYPTMSTERLDAVYDLPYTYQPHPKYRGKRIPAYDMICFSVCLHRGCFGGCSFCTISMHQGKHIASRSKESVLRQIEKLSHIDNFHGVLSDLGGPSANMYRISGINPDVCARCARPTCLFPKICPNLNRDFNPLIDLYRSVDALPYIRHSFVGSGIRYDLMSEEYGRELIAHHVSGRLKVAPEHTVDHVTSLMRKPSFQQYLAFRSFFYQTCRSLNLPYHIIPYFISSHPGCTQQDMAALSHECERMNYQPEQVQDFTPTPMTLSTTIFYTGLDPYTLQPIFVERNLHRKQQQRAFFFKKDSSQTPRRGRGKMNAK